MTPTPASEAGIGPGAAAVLVESLVADLVAGADVAQAVALHRTRRTGPLGAALGPLVTPVSSLEGLLDGLDADPRSEPLELVLVADSGLVAAGEARSVLLDDDRVTLLGLQLSLPVDGPLVDSARLTLDTLDFALPAEIGVPEAPGWEDALAVLAEDGAERALVLTGPHGASTAHLAAFVGACVRRGLSFSVAGGAWSAAGPGLSLVGLLAATAAALDAREPAHLAALLTSSDPTDALAVLADCEPRSVRRRLASVTSQDCWTAVSGLADLGLLEPVEL